MSQDRAIKNPTLTYIDNIYINEGLVPATHVREHLSDYGLSCKDLEKLEDGTKVLGLQVWGGRMVVSDRGRVGNQILHSRLLAEACSLYVGDL